MMTKTIYQMENDLATVGQELKATNDQIVEKAANPNVSDDELQQLNEHATSVQNRFNILKNQLDQRKQSEENKRSNLSKAQTPQQKQTAAYAQLIRDTMANKSVSPEILQALGDDSSLTGGQNLLPKTISDQFVSEPFENNPLRQDEIVTGITNLEVPRISIDTTAIDFVKDQELAKEIKEKGEMVTFGRHKFKASVGLSESILNGSDLDLTTYTNNGLASNLALKEKSVAFNPKPTNADEAHMSFYAPENKIKHVSGANLFDAIGAAASDIKDLFQENIKVYMRRQDYFAMIKELSNNAVSLYGKQPEEIIGYPVSFCELATSPVVGNFNYAQLNYDISSTLYEQWKDYDRGINKFGLTAWFDHQILLSSAFRIVDVTESGK